ncbi:hypothetical protein C1645_822246 [Glomus cerebriforme]|uniref:Uncharacterized protein n=1 Tax=Glomus cerebriforme TaxID=658196 RepID=A0A397T2Z8_9GLOM|nr:hypothetical protein C1645_822246 [Glomus cerebriforme]
MENYAICFYTYLKKKIITIQDEFGIIGYSDQVRAEEVNEKVRAYFQRFKEFYDSLEDDSDVILLKYGEMIQMRHRPVSISRTD